jgi:hypothetical protein
MCMRGPENLWPPGSDAARGDMWNVDESDSIDNQISHTEPC